jgi:DNA-directed RNA polymerase III subunit RPC11
MILDKRYFERKMMKSKEVEDVLGGADSWKNVDKTEVNCREEKCDNREAYFRQVQIRSADEPMTTFYKVCLMLLYWELHWLTSTQCTRCASEWREN